MDDNLNQAIDPALQEKIGNKFGLGAEPVEAPVESVEAVEDLFEVELDGATYQLPTKLKDAFMRNEDYTRKTQELGEQKRALEHGRELATQSTLESAFNASIADETREIALRDAYLSRVKNIDWSAMNTDQMLRQKHEIDVIKDERDNLKQSIADKRAKFSEDMGKKFKELRARSRELAAKSIPGFTEETEKVIREHAGTHGLSDQEIDNVLLDPRSAKILWEASQYAKVKASTGKAVEAATGKVVKPGASSEKMPPEVVAKLNYRKAIKGAHSSGERAALIEQRLVGGSIFK